MLVTEKVHIDGLLEHSRHVEQTSSMNTKEQPDEFIADYAFRVLELHTSRPRAAAKPNGTEQWFENSFASTSSRDSDDYQQYAHSVRPML
jgi:hypothetical protein